MCVYIYILYRVFKNKSNRYAYRNYLEQNYFLVLQNYPEFYRKFFVSF